MKLNYRLIFLFTLLIATMIAVFYLAGEKNKLPAKRTKDFNFIFSYGVGSKNQLDTFKGQYTKDMVDEPSITADLKLSDEDMDTIYSEVRRINILRYPDQFKPKSDSHITPYETYYFKITVDGIEKNMTWVDENFSQSRESVRLRNLFERIQEMIVRTKEYKKLPRAKGGYL
ncbi:MAG: hypothetical protein K0R71_1031 [Bacillales bacterium]|jgi:hypothetical protein|nr:hypothetical protein [Bacillales bacterium]